MHHRRCRTSFFGIFLGLLLVIHPVTGMSETGSKWRPNSKEFAVGITPKSHFLQKFGDTTGRDIIYLAGGTKDAGNVTSLAYSGPQASSWFSSSVRSSVESNRALVLLFNDDVLLAYRFTSTYKEDSTDFDESKTSMIEKEKTVQSDITNIFGEPSGMAIYPAAPQKGDTRLLYQYAEYDRSTLVLLKKNLQIDISEKGVVRDFDLVVEKTENVRFSTNSLTNFILVPIYKKR